MPNNSDYTLHRIEESATYIELMLLSLQTGDESYEITKQSVNIEVDNLVNLAEELKLS